MNSLLWDLREAIRGLLRTPGLVFICVLSLGLGSGVNLTLFSGLRTLLFEPATIADIDRVVGLEPGNSNQFSYLNYRDLKDAGIFESVVAHRRSELSVRTGEITRPVSGLAVSGNFFDGLGLRAQFGRTFTEAEAAPEQDGRIAVAGHAFWRGVLAADPNAVGKILNVNGQAYTLVGVLPARYRAPVPGEAPDLYVPLNVLGATNLGQRRNESALLVIARLRAGSAAEQVQGQLTAFGQQMEKAFPEDNKGMGEPAQVFPASQLRLRGGASDTGQLAGLLMGLVGLVLLVACGNVAGLLIVRGAGRRREIALRFALGANRNRMVRTLLAESLLLAIAGTTFALILVFWLAPILAQYRLLGSVRVELQPDLVLAAFAATLAFATTLICGIAPALRSTNGNLAADIQQGNSRTATGHLRLRHAFVIAQVAISLLLLVVASLFLRSLVRLSAADPGFDVAHGVVIKVPASSVPTGQAVEMSDRISESLRRTIGVRAVSTAMTIPLGNDLRAERFTVEGHPERRARTYVNSVAPGFFETLGIPLLRGRDFLASDRPGAPVVAIVSESFARAYFPDEEALGKMVGVHTGETATIVGIVKDHAYRNRAGVPEPVLYRSFAQIPNMSTQPRPLLIHARTDRPADESLETIRKAMAEFDPNSPAFVSALSDETSMELTIRKVLASLLSAVGALGLLLATIGLYGVMAYVVTSRTAEIAIQMALGASSEHLLWGVLGRGLKLVLIGVAIGSAIALAVTRPLAAMLAGLSPSDPVAFIGTALLLTAVGLVASFFPARRATHVDPMVALRQQ